MDRSCARSCKGKWPYGSKGRAKLARKAVAKAHPKWFFNVYHCRYCGKWHVGRRRQANRASVKVPSE